MANIKLGINREAIENANDTYDGPRISFPCNKIGYTKYTGTVTGLEIKQGNGANADRSWLWIQVSNGPYQDSLLINLDPSDVAPTTPQDKIEAAVKRNLDALLRAVKVLGIANADGSGIDTDKFGSAHGTLISFGSRLGDQQSNGYPKIYTSFYGKADSLIPVAGDMPMSPASGGLSIEDSIPF